MAYVIATETEPFDVVIYARQSQADEDDRDGVTRQLEDGRGYAELRGWHVVGEFVDNDISAAGKKKRPDFEDALKMIISGKAKGVIITEMSRIQRNRADEVRLYDACRERTAIIALVRGPDLDFSTASGRFAADVLGAVARQEIEMKAERQRRAQQQAAFRGQRVGGRRPFGYDSTGMTVIEEEAAAIRQGYDDFLAGVPLGSIARKWNKAGLTTGQGGKWDHNNVGAVLRNPRYCGKRAYLKEVVADAVWPAIISEPTFQAAKAILDDPSRRTGPKGGKALLTGIAVCGVCKDEAEGDTKASTVHAGGTAPKVNHRTYRCSGSLGHIARKAEPVDDFVGECVVERLSRPDAAELLVDRDAPDMAAISSELLALRTRQETVAIEFADGDLTAKQLKAINDRLRVRIAELELKIADVGRVDILGPLVYAEDVAAAWEGMDTDRQRAVIAALCDVVLHPVGRGTRTFRADTVSVMFRDHRSAADAG